MPNYEYRCMSCENQFEIWQEVGSSPPPCPECGKEVKKVFHPVRTIFKGSGFYVTDLRAEKGKTVGSAASETKSEPKTESTTEAPAATASESKTESTPAPGTPAPVPAAKTS